MVDLNLAFYWCQFYYFAAFILFLLLACVTRAVLLFPADVPRLVMHHCCWNQPQSIHLHRQIHCSVFPSHRPHEDHPRAGPRVLLVWERGSQSSRRPWDDSSRNWYDLVRKRIIKARRKRAPELLHAQRQVSQAWTIVRLYRGWCQGLMLTNMNQFFEVWTSLIIFIYKFIVCYFYSFFFLIFRDLFFFWIWKKECPQGNSLRLCNIHSKIIILYIIPILRKILPDFHFFFIFLFYCLFQIRTKEKSYSQHLKYRHILCHWVIISM